MSLVAEFCPAQRVVGVACEFANESVGPCDIFICLSPHERSFAPSQQNTTKNTIWD